MKNNGFSINTNSRRKNFRFDFQLIYTVPTGLNASELHQSMVYDEAFCDINRITKRQAGHPTACLKSPKKEIKQEIASKKAPSRRGLCVTSHVIL